MAKTFYWLRLQMDFLNDKRMKKLRKIAGGDTFTVIYLKLMLYSLKDEGVIEYEGVEKTFAEELSLVLDEDADNIDITLTFLKSCGLMVEMENNRYYLPEVASNIGSECSSAERVREYRKRQKALQCNEHALQCNTSVTTCNTEKSRVEENREETEKEENTPYQQVADMYNDTCVSFPRLTVLSDARKKAIRARLKVHSLDDFKIMFQKAEASNFLKGGNDRNWVATFDWMLKDTNMAKIIDGNYDNRPDARFRPETRNKVADQLEASYEMMRQWAEED